MLKIEIQGMNHSFQGEEILRDINCMFPSGQVTSIMGRSGAGKSTLLNLISGVQPYQAGSILFNGKKDIPPIGYMTQKDLLLPFKTVFGNLEVICSLQKKEKEKSREQIEHLLGQFHLKDIANKYPRELSGGLRQRVHMLRQFLIDSPLLLLDEPFGAIDIITKQMIQKELIDHIKQTGKTVILVTHDIKEAISFSDYLIILGGQPATVIREIDLSRWDKSLLFLEEEIIRELKTHYL